jgi:phosphonate transport system permease protein
MSAPPRPPLPALLRWPGLALLATLALAYRLSEGDVAALFGADARGAMAEFAGGFWPPAHDPELLRLLARPLLETVAIAILGLSLALALALPLSFLAASPGAIGGGPPGPARRVAWGVARAVLNLMRSIPEIIWALVLVRAVGMGPAAGILAIGIAYAGVIGKVFAEIFESTPRAPAEALVGLGATPLRAFTFATIPAALPVLASYGLYRFDCALRASAVLGLVGAGGLGVQLELSLKMFAYDEVATMVLALFTLVASVDLASRHVRRRIHRSAGAFPVGRVAVGPRAGGALAWLGLVAASAALLDLPWRDLLSLSALSSLGSFGASMFPPDLDPDFLRAIVPAVATTLGVSVLGTALAAVAGLLLALPIAYRAYAVADEGARPGPVRGALLGCAAWGARAVLNLGRTLPELLWALVLIFAVGLGPFAGALALGIHTAGVLGRLYAEALEEVPRGPLEALRGGGASGAAAAAFAALPQALPQLVAYTLYRWEVNIRASAVLGVVGAGGLGALLHVSLNLFHHHRTLTLVAVVVAMVTAVDLFSGWLRRRILEPAARPATGEVTGPAPLAAPW